MIDSATNTLKIRPQTGRIEKIMKSKSLRSKNSFSTSSIEETSSLVNDNLKDEKIKFFEELCKKSEFEDLIKEEADRIDMVNKKKNIMNKINLLEKNHNGLYNWKTLFNNSKPISSYIKVNNDKKEKEEENKEKNFQFPVVLVDLNENQLNYYLQNEENYIFHNNENNNKKRSKTSEDKLNEINYEKQNCFNQSKKKKKNGNCIRPMSINSKINKNDIFYFSQNFSDYFKEDLKDFVKKMPLLKPKIIQDPSRLKKAIKKAYKENEIRENKLKKILNSDTLILNKQDVIIAGKRNNPTPLLRSVFRQIHPESSMKNLRDKKLYLKTMKTINKNYSVDFIKNNKKKLVYNGINSNNNGLLLSTYNKNDPALAIFNKIKEENEENEDLENLDDNNMKINKEDKIINMKQETIKNNDNSNLIKINKINPNLNTKSSISEQIITNDTTIYNSTKTGIKKGKNKFNRTSGIMTSTNNINNKNRIKSASNISTLNTHQSTDSNLTLENNFIPKNYFPSRPSSGIVNFIYSKINQRLHIQNLNKNENIKKLNNEMKAKSLSTRNLNIPNYIKNKQFDFIQDNQNINNNNNNNNFSKWDFVSNKGNNNKIISCFNLNDYIDSVLVDDKKTIQKDKINYFYPINYFNKNSTILSCSNNANINAKRIKKNKIINNYNDEENHFYNNKKRRLKSAH